MNLTPKHKLEALKPEIRNLKPHRTLKEVFTGTQKGTLKESYKARTPNLVVGSVQSGRRPGMESRAAGVLWFPLWVA